MTVQISLVSFILCLFACFVGVAVANVAVQEMRDFLNEDRSPEDQLKWHDAIQRNAQKVIDLYRASNPDGPLYRKLVLGYYITGISAAVLVGMAFVFKFAG